MTEPNADQRRLLSAMYGVTFPEPNQVAEADVCTDVVDRKHSRSPSIETKRYLKHIYGVRGYSDDIASDAATATATAPPPNSPTGPLPNAPPTSPVTLPAGTMAPVATMSLDAK